jgi:DNA-binding NarL/FixJ family response regulator
MNMEQPSIKIAIVDDHTLFRNGVATLMANYKELSMIFEASNGKDLMARISQGQLPDVILMDINMPGADGYAATTWIKSNYPQIAVLALSMCEDDEAIIKMIKCGAGGYLLKECSPRELLDAIITIHKKGVFLNELVSGTMMKSIKKKQEVKLSAKELEFLELVCSELTYKEIADKMFVSPRTIDNYRESLFQKLNLKTRSGLLLYAIKNNIHKL